MNEIEESLMNAFFDQDEIDDADVFVQKYASKESLEYLKESYAARERLKREGKI